MRIDKLTTKFQQALADAQSLALAHDNGFIEPQHLLAALLAQEDGGTASLLQRAGVNVGPLRKAIVDFLRRKWGREGEYALRKDLWAFTADRIAVRFQYESRDASGQWWRSYGNEQWEFDAEGYMRRREASINDVAIEESERRIFGPRPESERGAPLPLA